MGEITIPLDDRVLARLRLQAEARNLSVEQLVQEMLGANISTGAEERIAAFRRLRAMTLRPLASDSTELIRTDRDSR